LIKHSDFGGVTVLLIYVDDIIVSGNDEREEQRMSHSLAKEFEIKTFRKVELFFES